MYYPLSIFSYTSQEYASLIHNALGKGAQHALLMYSEWFRSGKIEGNHPAFLNAQALYREICSLTDCSYPAVNASHQEGGTGKFLLKTKDQLEIESVIIPMQAGSTLCVSSQLGCKMGCSFCETGRMGLLRNLAVSEIVSQAFIAKFVLKTPIRNIVLWEWESLLIIMTMLWGPSAF